MKTPEAGKKRRFVSVLLFVVTTGLFASPFTGSWPRLKPAWYLPFLLWAVVIALAATLGDGGHDD